MKAGPLVELLRGAGLGSKVQFSAATGDSAAAVKRVEQATALILVSE